MATFEVILSESLPKYSDKCIFPPEVLENALAASSSLPHPLVFLLDSTLVGVKEFTAPPNTILVPKDVYKKLATLAVSCSLYPDAERATFLTLKPLQFYPHVTNWKYYLESFLSTFYTTLSKGQTFRYYDVVAAQRVEVLVEDSNASSVIVVDTDIALDVMPMDDTMGAQQLEQAKALTHLENVPLLEKPVDLVLEPFHNTQVPHIFKISLRLLRFIHITLTSSSDIHNVDILGGLDKLLTLENFSYCTMLQDPVVDTTKTMVVDTRSDKIANCIERHKEDSWLYIVAFAWSLPSSVRLSVEFADVEHVEEQTHEVGTECKNCGKFIDPAQFQLHEAYCLRNIIRCSCGQVFTKEISPGHWHCSSCDAHGNSATFKFKHDKLYHELPYRCTQCSLSKEFSSFIEMVQEHKSTECAAKLVECLFCHLIVPQEEATYEDRFANLSHHESQCGNKTAECYQCGKVLRNKDMAKHLQMHTIVKKEENAKIVQTCLNHVCSNIRGEDDDRANTMGLCGTCYGPLYLTLLDKDNAKLQNRIERKYVLQLTKGCGNHWCRNPECSSSQGKIGIKEALTRVKEVLLPAIAHPKLPINNDKSIGDNEFWFCVNENNQRKRNLIDALVAEGEFPESLIYKAVNREGAEGAKVWLRENA